MRSPSHSDLLYEATYIVEEDAPPVCRRIQLSRATVKELHSRLRHAYQRDDVRLVRRITVLHDLLVHQVPVEVLSDQWGISSSCLYHWRQAFLLRGMDSLVYRHSGGRPRIEEKNPAIEAILEQLLDNDAAGDPMSEQKWMRISTNQLAKRLKEAGHP